MLLSAAGEHGIGGAVAVRQLRGVNDVMASRLKLTDQSNGKLRVDQEPHAAPSRTTRLSSGTGAVLEPGQQIIGFEVGIVVEDLSVASCPKQAGRE